MNNLLEFYVIDDLKKTGYHMEYFDNLDSAREQFGSLDGFDGKMPVLGVQVGTGGLDLVHRLNGDNVLITDYKKSDALSSDMKSVFNIIDAAANELINEGVVQFRSCHSILPWRDMPIKVIVPVTPDFTPDAYCNDKILKAGDGIPAVAINELFVEGDGWVKYKDILQDPSKYAENDVLKVEKVNVAYVNSEKLVGVNGQMDLSVDNFEYMAEKINKPYYISVSDMDNRRLERGNFAIMSFDTLPEAVKAWYEVNDKVEFTPGVMDKKAGCCVFNGCNENFEEITYEEAAEIYSFELDDSLSKDGAFCVDSLKADERSYTFRLSEELKEETGFIGHLRADFGSGKEFWPTWNEFSSARKTNEFSKELDEVINALRFDEKYNGLLKDRDSLASYCWKNKDTAFEDGRNNHGVRIDTGKFSYLFRLNPNRGDYNVYCYCYEKDLLNEHLHNAEKVADVDKLINDAVKASKNTVSDGIIKDNIELDKE